MLCRPSNGATRWEILNQGHIIWRNREQVTLPYETRTLEQWTCVNLVVMVLPSRSTVWSIKFSFQKLLLTVPVGVTTTKVWPVKKKLENIFLWGQPFSVLIFFKYFFTTGSSKIFAHDHLRICSTGPLIFPHPSASLLEFQLILVKKSTTTEMGFNSYPNISQKSEIIKLKKKMEAKVCFS